MAPDRAAASATATAKRRPMTARRRETVSLLALSKLFLAAAPRGARPHRRDGAVLVVVQICPGLGLLDGADAREVAVELRERGGVVRRGAALALAAGVVVAVAVVHGPRGAEDLRRVVGPEDLRDA